MSADLNRASAHLAASVDLEVLDALRRTGWYLAPFGVEDATRFAFPIGPLGWTTGDPADEPTDPLMVVVTKAPPPQVTVTVVMADDTLNDMKRVGDWPTARDPERLADVFGGQ